MKSVAVILALLIGISQQQSDGGSGDVIWDKAFIDQIAGGKALNCFKDSKTVAPETKEHVEVDIAHYEFDFVGTGELDGVHVHKLEIHDGVFCIFDEDYPFAITQTQPLDQYGRGLLGYYFPYYGYGPSIQAKQENCHFEPIAQTKLFAEYAVPNNVWFEPNLFGGACKYMVLLGCLLDHDHDAEH